jgi:hypothetical protein
MASSLTEILGHARAQDRAGKGHKARRHIKRDVAHLRAKIEAATDPAERTKLSAIIRHKLDILFKLDQAAARRGNTFTDPRSRRSW